MIDARLSVKAETKINMSVQDINTGCSGKYYSV